MGVKFILAELQWDTYSQIRDDDELGVIKRLRGFHYCLEGFF